MKFGIYEDYGNFTCAGYPGILGHLKTDADTFAEWDVDYVKLDGNFKRIMINLPVKNDVILFYLKIFKSSLNRLLLTSK